MSQFVPSISALFARNLRALARVQGGLAKRLARPSVESHIVGTPPQLVVHRSRYPLQVDASAMNAALPKQPKAMVLVFGVGMGELVIAALDSSPNAKVVAWDRDPAMIRQALQRVDVSQAIENGRLVFALGADLLDHLPLSDCDVVFHPLLQQIYRWEAAWLEGSTPARRALVCTGGLFVDDVADALTKQGIAVFPWDIHRLSPDELDVVCARVEPEFVFAINHTHGLAEACRSQAVPLLVWEIDPATDGLKPAGTETDHVCIHTYRASNVARFEAAGFTHVQYTPLAANTVRRSPSPQPLPEGHQVCFVGASMVDQAQHFRRVFLDLWEGHFGNRPGARQQGAKILDAVLAAQRAHPRKYIIPILLKRHLEAFIDAVSSSVSDDPVAMVAEMAAAERRLNVVARLGGEGIHVWGDPGWKAVTASGAVYEGFAGHNRQLTDIYRSGRIHVDVNRLYQLDIVPMRVFDILACGGFLIAEYSPALEDLFELGVELETWKTVEELVQKVQFYKANPERAQAIATRGLEAVRTRHTIAGRVAAMVSDLPIRRGEVSAG